MAAVWQYYINFDINMLTLNYSSHWPAVNMDDDGDIRGVDEDVWSKSEQ